MVALIVERSVCYRAERSAVLRDEEKKMNAVAWLRTRLSLLRLYALRAELRFAPTEAQRLFILTIVIGVVCGFAAVGFHFAIATAERFLLRPAMEAPGHSWMFWAALSPAFGGLVSGVLLQYVVPGARGSGIPQVKVAYATRGAAVTLRDAIGKFFLGSLQIGSGGSLGREGPTVHICAGIASAIGRLGRISPAEPPSPDSRRSRRRDRRSVQRADRRGHVHDRGDRRQARPDRALRRRRGGGARGRHRAQRARATPGVRRAHGQGLDRRASLVLYAALGVAAAVASVVFTDGLLRRALRFRDLRAVPVWTQPPSAAP